MTQQPIDQPVPSEIYDTNYFLTELEGAEEFVETNGGHLPERLSYSIEVGDVQPGMKVLDAGFGRGELLLHCYRLGAVVVGVDYSSAAVNLAADFMRDAVEPDAKRINILRADIKHLPFPDQYFDRIFVLDVVEHLHPWELDEALQDLHRILSPKGKLIVHTMPNRWYYAIGYPAYRLFQRLRGRDLPRDPHERWTYMPTVHVNEQSPFSLRKVLARHGFSAKTWLRPVRTSGDDLNQIEGRAKFLLSTVFPLKYVFCSSIFAVAERREDKQLST